MAQNITKSVQDLLNEAEDEVETISVREALALYKDPGVVFVDLRDIGELEREGIVPGAFHCPRGLLEFWIDPNSASHKRFFNQDKRYVFFCAGGLRSALSAQSAQRMGLKPVSHLAGGFGAWKRAGAPITFPEHAPGEDQA